MRNSLLTIIIALSLIFACFSPIALASNEPRLITEESSIVVSLPNIEDRHINASRSNYYNYSPYNSQDIIAYSTLNNAEKVMYDNIVNSAVGQTTIQVDYSPMLTYDEYTAISLQAIYEAIAFDHTEMFWLNSISWSLSYYDNNRSGSLDSGDTIPYIAVNVIIDTSIYPDVQALNTQLWNTVKSLNFTYNNRYELIKAIHDYLCNKNVYDLNASRAHDVIGAIIDGKSVCQGYAEAFKMLCDYYKIPCLCPTGNAVTSTGGGPHMWNAIKMDDGKWYLLDATWDDQGTIYTDFFLVGTKSIPTHFQKTTFDASHQLETTFGFTGSIAVLPYPQFSETAYVKTAANEYTAFAATENAVAESAQKLLYTSFFDGTGGIYYNGLNITLPDGASTGTSFAVPSGTNFTPQSWRLISYGDVNGDNSSDVNDYSAVVNKALSATAISTDVDRACDVTRDGVVDVLDIMIYQLCTSGANTDIEIS